MNFIKYAFGGFFIYCFFFLTEGQIYPSKMFLKKQTKKTQAKMEPKSIRESGKWATHDSSSFLQEYMSLWI